MVSIKDHVGGKIVLDKLSMWAQLLETQQYCQDFSRIRLIDFESPPLVRKCANNGLSSILDVYGSVLNLSNNCQQSLSLFLSLLVLL